MNKPSESIKYFEDIMKFPKKIGDTTGLVYNSTIEKGESSSNGEKKNNKGKPICHYCRKKGHTTNVCRSKNGSQRPRQKEKASCNNCKNQGHQTHEC